MEEVGGQVAAPIFIHQALSKLLHGQFFKDIDESDFKTKSNSANDDIGLCLNLGGSLTSVEPAKLLHGQAIKFGFDGELYVRTCLVDVYARRGDVVSARKLFDAMPKKSLVSLTTMITCYAKYGMIDEARVLFDGLEERDAICWNVLIDGYTQHGLPNEGLVLFRQMLKAKVRPNEVTVLAVLSACGDA